MLANSTPTLDWREEFIPIYRRSRFETNQEEIKSLLLRAMDVQILLQQKRDYSQIVLKFPASVQQLPETFQAVYAHFGVTIEGFFSEVLFKSPRKGSSTLWSELVRTSYKAYREAWLHLLKSLYLGHSHPAADKIIDAELNTLQRKTIRTVGRRQSHKDEQLSIERRFRQLRVDCEIIYNVVRECIENKLSRQAIRRTVFGKIRGKRFDNNVLAKKRNAWKEMLHGKRGKRSTVPCLEDPTTWRPDQLAIALLAKERDFSYQTIEKKTANIRKHKQY